MSTKIFWHPKKGLSLDSANRIELLAARAGLRMASTNAPKAAQALEDIEKVLVGQGVDLEDIDSV